MLQKLGIRTEKINHERHETKRVYVRVLLKLAEIMKMMHIKERKKKLVREDKEKRVVRG